MKAFTDARGALYRFALVTNGSLFTRKMAEELVLLGLETVKITLDGPAEIHNHSRPFKSGAGSFDTIIRNIKETSDLVKISIGGNFEKHNYKQFVFLLDYLGKKGLTADNLSFVKFDPVLQRSKGDLSPTDYSGGCISILEPWLLDAEALLREEILKRGYYTPKPVPMSCMIETTDSYVINVDGNIYKCPGFIGKNGFEAGNLEKGVIDYSDAYKLGIWREQECAECVYLPLCFGGCRYMTYVRDGNINNIDCRKDYFDASLETLLKQDIKYRLQK